MLFKKIGALVAVCACVGCAGLNAAEENAVQTEQNAVVQNEAIAPAAQEQTVQHDSKKDKKAVAEKSAQAAQTEKARK